MPRTRSPRSLSERRHFAEELFLKGFTISDVARKLDVSWDTAKGYKKWHEERLAKEAGSNPRLLSDVMQNTVRSIAELDQVRAAAWRTYHTADSKQLQLQALNSVRQANQDKARLFGLLGVKHEFYARVQVVNAVQTKLIDFLQNELCDTDRRKIESFLTSPEVVRYMQETELPLIEIGVGEEDIDDIEVVA